MSDPVARVLDPFLAAADAAIGGRYSAVLYGSSARGDYLPGRSNINLILLLDDASPEVLRSLSRAFAGWRKEAPEPPLLMTRDEWTRATDVFPIEIADMRTGYRVLRGPDPIHGLRIDPADLRRALEREFHGKLLRLRQGYTALTPDPAALGALATDSVGSILVLFRALLTLLGRPVPATPLELAAAAGAAIAGDGGPLALVVRHRHERHWRCSPDEFEAYLGVVERATRFLDQLQLGDL
jgi:predicted nucleotidyltransferase